MASGAAPTVRVESAGQDPSDVGVRSGNIEHSPRKLRRMANATLHLPLELAVPKLPAQNTVSISGLLAWHSAQLAHTGGLTGDRRRVRSKGPAPIGTVATLLARDPEAVLDDRLIIASDRLKASQAAAKVFAWAYGLSAREGRRLSAPLWTRSSQQAKNNWYVLTSYAEYPDLLESALVQAERAATDCESFGALFTWQTSIGRQDDIVKYWISHGVVGEQLSDLMSGDASLKASFDVFCSWLAAQTQSCGFAFWAAAMETNMSGSAAVVHLHAYVCQDWRTKGSSKWVKGNASADAWAYGSYTPDCRLTWLRGNCDPKKLMTSGLFYCSAKKVGSVFQASNLTPGKDGVRPHIGGDALQFSIPGNRVHQSWDHQLRVSSQAFALVSGLACLVWSVIYPFGCFSL